MLEINNGKMYYSTVHYDVINYNIEESAISRTL